MTDFRRAPILLALFCLCLYLPGILSIPVTDRDEARFAQASKQMVETGDYLNINLQDEPRHRKPIGIYWLQAGTVDLFGPAYKRDIAVYRLPSLIAATLLVLTIAALGRLFCAETAAILAGLLMASSLVLFGEAMLAKTDAALAASIGLAQYCLARIYLSGRPVPLWVGLLFWFALGVSILIKGPVGPAVIGLTVITLCIIERGAGWLRQTRPWLGICLCLAVTLPWFVAIGYETHGAFFAHAIGGDLAPKLRSGDLFHGAPPGYHTLLLAVVFWPASLFLLPAAIDAWRERRDRAVTFCLAWFLPAFLLFEIVPTKLPHYTLPVLPALALLIARTVANGAAALNGRAARIAYRIWPIIGLALAAFSVAAPIYYGDGVLMASIIPAGFACFAAILPASLALRRRFLQSAMSGVLLSSLTIISLLTLVGPKLDKLFLSPRLLQLDEAIDPDRTRPVVVAGYSEASVPFLLGTGVKLADSGTAAAERLIADPNTLAFVESREQEAFIRRLAEAGRDVEPLGTINGLNYSNGRKVGITMFSVR